jgi:hypothetical protein
LALSHPGNFSLPSPTSRTSPKWCGPDAHSSLPERRDEGCFQSRVPVEIWNNVPPLHAACSH